MPSDYHFEWETIESTIKQEYRIDNLKLLRITFFDHAYEEGTNIGEIEISYIIPDGRAALQENHSIWGLYTDGHISLFMD